MQYYEKIFYTLVAVLNSSCSSNRNDLLSDCGYPSFTFVSFFLFFFFFTFFSFIKMAFIKYVWLCVLVA